MLPSIPPDIPSWWYFLCVGASVLVVGIAKAGFGGGIGILALPLMATVMPARHMMGIMLPLLIAADVLSNAHYLREYEWALLRWLLAGAVAGVAVGSAALWSLQQIGEQTFQTVLGLSIGLVCLLVVGLQAYRLTGRSVPALQVGPGAGLGTGFAAGTVSTISHSAGPIVALYVLQANLPKRRVMGTLLMYFLLGNLTKVPSFVALGLINRRTLLDSIWFIPLVPLGTLAGAWMNHRMPERPFAIVMYGLAALTALNMVLKAVGLPAL